MKQICVITHALTQGGSETDMALHCEFLAQLYAQQPAGHQVTLMYAGFCEPASLPVLNAYYAKFSIAFDCIRKADFPPYSRPGISRSHTISDVLSQKLLQKPFDIAFFPDHEGMAYVALQHKRAGLGLHSTRLAVIFNAPTRWAFPVIPAKNASPRHGLRQDFMERYCAQHADLLLSPTQAVVDWAAGAGWQLCPQQQVMPRLMPPTWFAPQQTPLAHPEHLLYVGPIERTKGFFVFLEALCSMGSKLADLGIQQLTLLTDAPLGELSRTDGRVRDLVKGLIAARIHVVHQPYRHITEAIRFAQQSGGIAVFPSLSDNAPYLLLAAIAARLPLLTSNAPGMGELVPGSRQLDVSTSAALMDGLSERQTRLQAPAPTYDHVGASRRWNTLLDAVATPVAPSENMRWPALTVCVSYYNKGTYLAETLRSLRDTAYPKLEVVVVDDGSTEPADLATFAEQQALYAPLGWQFVHQTNQGLGLARNAGAQLAKTKLLVFFDADDIADPQMLHDYARGMQKTQADCLTSYFAAFEMESFCRIESKFTYGYVPVGGCWQLGFTDNTFGGANFIIKKTVFDALGGFTKDRTGCEDWEFLAKLSLQGYRQEVLPKNCFYYRQSVGSMSKTMGVETSRRRGMRSYKEMTDAQWEELTQTLLVPLVLNDQCMQGMERQLQQAQAAQHQLTEENKRLRQQVAAARALGRQVQTRPPRGGDRPRP
jgi:glycosyltransferase involved in cell wall biosynthesis/GT2 family glycosyltransferase